MLLNLGTKSACVSSTTTAAVLAATTGGIGGGRQCAKQTSTSGATMNKTFSRAVTSSSLRRGYNATTSRKPDNIDDGSEVKAASPNNNLTSANSFEKGSGGGGVNSTAKLFGVSPVPSAYKGNNLISANKLRHLGINRSNIMPYSCFNHQHEQGEGYFLM